MGGRSERVPGRRGPRYRALGAAVLAVLVAGLAGCGRAGRVGCHAAEPWCPPPPRPRAPRPPVRVLQLNLCNSGIAGCYTGRSVAEASRGDPGRGAGPGHPERDLRRRRAGAGTGARRGRSRWRGRVRVPGGARPAHRGRVPLPQRQAVRDRAGLAAAAGAWGTAAGGIYPSRTPDDPEERAWLCLDVAAVPAVAVCTTHLADTSRRWRAPSAPTCSARSSRRCARGTGRRRSCWAPTSTSASGDLGGPAVLPAGRRPDRRRRRRAAGCGDPGPGRHSPPHDRHARGDRPPGPARHAHPPVTAPAGPAYTWSSRTADS